MIKPVADLYLITYGNGAAYITTRDASKAVAAVGAGFKVEEFVSLENHRATTQAEPWIKCSERMPDEYGRYWCYVEEQNSLGKSHYQWNCSWNGDEWSDDALTGRVRVTHWMPLPAEPEQEG